MKLFGSSHKHGLYSWHAFMFDLVPI